MPLNPGINVVGNRRHLPAHWKKRKRNSCVPLGRWTVIIDMRVEKSNDVDENQTAHTLAEKKRKHATQTRQKNYPKDRRGCGLYSHGPPTVWTRQTKPLVQFKNEWIMPYIWVWSIIPTAAAYSYYYTNFYCIYLDEFFHSKSIQHWKPPSRP